MVDLCARACVCVCVYLRAQTNQHTDRPYLGEVGGEAEEDGSGPENDGRIGVLEASLE